MHINSIVSKKEEAKKMLTVLRLLLIQYIVGLKNTYIYIPKDTNTIVIEYKYDYCEEGKEKGISGKILQTCIFVCIMNLYNI